MKLPDSVRPTSTGEHPDRPRGQVRPISLWPACASLAIPASGVGLPDAILPQLLADLEATMFAASGVGLAAPQIGVGLRVAVICVENELIEMVNPQILEAVGEVRQDELATDRPDPVRVDDAVEVIDLVLEGAREQPLGVMLLPITGRREPADLHARGAAHHQRVPGRDREAALRLGKAKKFNRAAGNTWTPGGRT